MSKALKIVAYVVLVVAAAWCGFSFHRNYAVVMAPLPEEEGGKAVAEQATARDLHGQAVSRLMTFGAGLFAAILGLGLMSAHDLTRFFANRVEEFVFNDDGAGLKDPEYEQAEKAWADGKFLEAIQLMRDYLARHPREQHVALRIAEIYEKDLGNYLAAALEYEEVLKKKLPAERWGWAAIHLANLYSGKLNRLEEAEALLHRIVTEYGRTSAAKKARERLGLAEPGEETAPAAEAEVVEAVAPEPEPPPAEQSASNLPPGFRPKKG
jgi:TolA-binding protein